MAGRSRGIVNGRANTGAVLAPRVSLTTRHGKALNCPGRDEPITSLMSNSRNVKHGRAAQDAGAASNRHSPAISTGRTPGMFTSGPGWIDKPDGRTPHREATA